MKNKSIYQGSMLVEVLVVSAIISVVSVAFLGTFALISRFHEKNLRYIKAELISEEGMEALRFIKGQNFPALVALTTESPHYLTFITSSWTITSTPEIIDGAYSRHFVTHQVRRDSITHDIVPSGGYIDPETILFEVHTDWQWRNATNTAIYQSYMTGI